MSETEYERVIGQWKMQFRDPDTDFETGVKINDLMKVLTLLWLGTEVDIAAEKEAAREFLNEEAQALDPDYTNFVHRTITLFDDLIDRSPLHYAEKLVRSIQQRCYPEVENFEPLSGDLWGLLTQLDNMMTGMERKPTTVNARFETTADNITGTQSVPVKRVEMEDDGSYTVVIDYWPGDPLPDFSKAYNHPELLAKVLMERGKANTVHDIERAANMLLTLGRTLETVALWAWRERPEHSTLQLTDKERVSVIRNHPIVKYVASFLGLVR